ncbi:MAG: hypothetical protein COB98_08405 [Flavobacteriaceae bacterium]|nr:MAG: hypothetical protein COB98_08405 [Flavobacteriaceae bacterium]
MGLSTQINFKKERDLGSIISDTFRFIRENWRSYFSFIGNILGPMLLIAAALMVFLYIAFAKSYKGLLSGVEAGVGFEGGGGGLEALGNIFGYGFLLMLVWVVIYVLLSMVSLFYIKSYIAHGQADFKEVKTNTYANFWKFLGLTMLMTLMILVSYVFFLIPVFYMAVVLSLAMPIMAFESKSVGDTISHCFSLIKSHWWSTFGVIIVLTMLVSILQMIFAIPQMFYQLIASGVFLDNGDPSAIVELMDDPINIVLNVVAYIGQFLFYSVTFIASAFIYFDLNEQKYGTGTSERIDNLGL